MIPSYVGADICLREYSTDKGRPELSLAYGFVRLTAADLSAVHEAICMRIRKTHAERVRFCF